MGLVWSVPLSFKGNDRESPKGGGGERIVGGGSKNVFGEGFFAEFTVCFPPPCVFHPPWPLSDIGKLPGKNTFKTRVFFDFRVIFAFEGCLLK